MIPRDGMMESIMNQNNRVLIRKLLDKGVRFPAPESVEIGKGVDPNRISGKGVVIHSGCKIYGQSTLILDNSRIGFEGPATIVDCQIGSRVDLGGGFYKDAVFLPGASTGCGAHVRKGTIIEEEASIAHTVGIKQTILFPYVTLGSLINFCDILMAGGTDRKNHSEVGSSYIHFNFTPNQDKATASLIGDVPRGVMLRQQPIFLGGQGGLVGPCHIEYGTVIAAGTIHRKDESRPDRLIFGGGGKGGNVPYRHGHYHGEKRILKNNISYIANLMALKCWYETVRSQFVSPDFSQSLLDGAIHKVQMGIDERIHRFEEFIIKLRAQKKRDGSDAEKPLTRQNDIWNQWPVLKEYFTTSPYKKGNDRVRETFLEAIGNVIDQEGKSYLRVIKNLDSETASMGTGWLQSIVDDINNRAFDIIPSLK